LIIGLESRFGYTRYNQKVEKKKKSRRNANYDPEKKEKKIRVNQY